MKKPSEKNKITIDNKVAFRYLGYLAYLALSFVIFKNLWLHFGSSTISEQGDPGIAFWSLSALSHNLFNLENPFYSQALWAPNGTNLIDNTTEPLLGAVFSPITHFLNASYSITIILTLCPVLNAISCSYLVKNFTKSELTRFLSGLIFGFNPFFIQNAEFAHLGETALFLMPLIYLVAYRAFCHKSFNLNYALILGILLLLEFLISPEILAIITFVGIVSLAVFFLSEKINLITYVADNLRSLGIFALFCAALFAYPLYFSLCGPSASIKTAWKRYSYAFGINWYDTVYPGKTIGQVTGFNVTGGYFGRDGLPGNFLGYGLLALTIYGIYIAVFKNRLWILLASLFASIVGVTGASFNFGVAPVAKVNHLLPWYYFGKLPVLSSIIPQRFLAVLWLLEAILFSFAFDSLSHSANNFFKKLTKFPLKDFLNKVLRAFFLLLLFAPFIIYSELPISARALYVPKFFQEDKNLIPQNSIVLTFPLSGYNASSAAMVWDSVINLRYKLAAGDLFYPMEDGLPLQLNLHAPEPYLALVKLAALKKLTLRDFFYLKKLLVLWKVNYVLIEKIPINNNIKGAFIVLLNEKPVEKGGMWVFKVNLKKV